MGVFGMNMCASSCQWVGKRGYRKCRGAPVVAIASFPFACVRITAHLQDSLLLENYPLCFHTMTRDEPMLRPRTCAGPCLAKKSARAACFSSSTCGSAKQSVSFLRPICLYTKPIFVYLHNLPLADFSHGVGSTKYVLSNDLSRRTWQACTCTQFYAHLAPFFPFFWFLAYLYSLTLGNCNHVYAF